MTTTPIDTSPATPDRLKAAVATRDALYRQATAQTQAPGFSLGQLFAAEAEAEQLYRDMLRLTVGR